MVLTGQWRSVLGRTVLSSTAKPVLWVLCALPALYLAWAVWAEALGANPAEALIRGLGDWALRFLCLVLAVTPLRVTLGLPALARWRRSLGVTVWVYALLHLLAYAWLDMGLVLSDVVADVLKRPFIAVGMLAMVLLTALALTSFNRAVRWLGAARWQRLHRTVYAVAGLAVLHFWWMRAGKNNFADVWLYGGILAVLLGWRLWRWRSRLRSLAPGAADPQPFHVGG